jgi:hypothetical protein
MLLSGLRIEKDPAMDWGTWRNTVIIADRRQDTASAFEVLTVENSEREDKNIPETAFIAVEAEPRLRIRPNRDDITHGLLSQTG